MTSMKKMRRLFLLAALCMLAVPASAVQAADDLPSSLKEGNSYAGKPRSRIDHLRKTDDKVLADDDEYEDKARGLGGRGRGTGDREPLPFDQYPNVYNDYIQPIAAAIDYHNGMVYLFNYQMTS